MNWGMITPELNTALIGLVVAFLTYLASEMRKRTEKATATSEHHHTENASILREITNSLKEVRRDIGGLREEIRHLHKVDESIRYQAEEDHKLIWEQIKRMEHGQ